MSPHTLFRTIICSMFMLSALMAKAQWSKMSPMVRRMAMQSHSGMRKSSVVKDIENGRTTVLVRSKGTEVLEDDDIKLLGSWGDIHAVSVPVSRLGELASRPEVSRIEAGKSCSLTLDTTHVMVNVDNVWNGTVNNTSFTGKGVVVGVMDIGFDLTHPTFFTEDMQGYRIKALWDQLDLTDRGEPYEGNFLGRQYVTRESLLGIGHSYDAFLERHGSHTASTAAGSGAPLFMGQNDKLFRGMAYEADLCLVANATSSNKDSIPVENRNLYTTASDLLGFKYIFDYAEAHGQPCVVSFSEGYSPDFYGEDMLYAEALARMLGPGKILCASAGNEAHINTYIQKSKDEERAGAFIVSNSSSFVSTFRHSGHLTTEVTFYPYGIEPIRLNYDTEKLLMYPDSTMMDTMVVDGKRFVVGMCIYHSCYDADDWASEFALISLDGNGIGFIPVSLALKGNGVDAEMYILSGYCKSNALDPSLIQMDNTHNIVHPGGLPGVICVGSVNSRRGVTSENGFWTSVDWGEIGEWSGFSSVGPAINGQRKPDVMAPGSSVYAAGSTFWSEANPGFDWTIVHSFSAQDRNYSWCSSCGTSMSTPVVAGVVALWLEACPTLTPEQVMETIQATAIHPVTTMTFPNNYYGHGNIDAAEGLRYILSHFSETDVEAPVALNEKDMRLFDLTGREVSVPTSGHVYVRGGKKVLWR